MKYALFILGLGMIITYHTYKVNHMCETPSRMGRTIITHCNKEEAFNNFSEQQNVFGRAIVK